MNPINDQVLALWTKIDPKTTKGRMPLLLPEIKLNQVLFIGINPSFSKKGYRSILAGHRNAAIDIDKFFAFPNEGSFDLQLLLEIEKLAKEKYSYFSKFRKIGKITGLGWEHIDLFFIQETNQKELMKMVFDKGEELNSFGLAQLELSKSLVESAKPKVIVVANALASRLFERHFKAQFCEDRGYHVANIAGKDTPVFLTSMLTGQRALDNFSFQRLCWHIKKTTKTRN